MTTACVQLFSGLSKLSILTEHGDQVYWEAGDLAQIIEAYVDARLSAALINSDKFPPPPTDNGESIGIDTTGIEKIDA